MDQHGQSAAVGQATAMVGRSRWTALSDEQLLAQCAVDTYRASGPGGQKRNKTSSAVRLRHGPSGLSVIAEESRSQHENKARALKRLRHSLYLHIREAIPQLSSAGLAQHPDWWQAALDTKGLPRSERQPEFWPAVGIVLDVLQAVEGRVAEAAQLLGTTTAQLVHFLQRDPKVWQQANRLRQRFGHPPLR